MAGRPAAQGARHAAPPAAAPDASRAPRRRALRGPFDGERVHVLAEMCATCVFRPGNLMRLAPGRLRGMVRDSVAAGSAITCHSTLYGQAEQEAVCRGFYDRHAGEVPALRAAAATGRLALDEPPAK